MQRGGILSFFRLPVSSLIDNSSLINHSICIDLQLFDPPSAVTTDYGDEDESDLDLLFPIFDQCLSDGQLAYRSRGDTGSLVWESRG